MLKAYETYPKEILLKILEDRDKELQDANVQIKKLSRKCEKLKTGEENLSKIRFKVLEKKDDRQYIEILACKGCMHNETTSSSEYNRSCHICFRNEFHWDFYRSTEL